MTQQVPDPSCPDVRVGLLGYTGFVGGNLARQIPIDSGFNRSNIAEIGSEEYDLFFCAGTPAEKWRANKEPEADRAAITRLTEHLASLRATKVVLISTVDVYPAPVLVDEETPIDAMSVQPYGRHRLELERWMCERFDTTVIRLPALYGEGLKKNAVYDLLHDNMVDSIHADGSFQWYGLQRLWPDIRIALDRDLRLINFAVEPVSMREVAREAFGIHFDNEPDGVVAASYDCRSIHAGEFDGEGGYMQKCAEVLRGIRSFVESQRLVRA